MSRSRDSRDSPTPHHLRSRNQFELINVAARSNELDAGFDPRHNMNNMEQTRFAPFPFLLLSRELRDNICEHLLTSPRALLSWPEDRNHWRPPSRDEAERFELSNQYPVQDLKSDTTALQLTCHQIYGETTGSYGASGQKRSTTLSP